jgi:hypothetical protein
MNDLSIYRKWLNAVINVHAYGMEGSLPQHMIEKWGVEMIQRDLFILSGKQYVIHKKNGSYIVTM